MSLFRQMPKRVVDPSPLSRPPLPPSPRQLAGRRRQRAVPEFRGVPVRGVPGTPHLEFRGHHTYLRRVCDPSPHLWLWSARASPFPNCQANRCSRRGGALAASGARLPLLPRARRDYLRNPSDDRILPPHDTGSRGACSVPGHPEVGCNSCRMYSRGDRDTLHLPKDVRAYVRAEALGRHQLHLSSQQLLQKEGQLHEVVE